MSEKLQTQAAMCASAVFHYLGPAFAVLLFARLEVLGVAWLRIASAAIVLGLWRRPWRTFAGLDRDGRRLILGWGVVLAAMNCCFYEALDRLPLATVASIEFVPVVLLAALGARTRRNAAALTLAVGGVLLVTGGPGGGNDALGLLLAAANAALFATYIVIGHRSAEMGTAGGIDGLALAMCVALVAVTIPSAPQVIPAFADPVALLAGVGVGICSSVIPYVADQFAMARVPRATYALMVALLPATAVVIGIVVLGQMPSAAEVLGVALVATAVALHAPNEARSPARGRAAPAQPAVSPRR